MSPVVTNEILDDVSLGVDVISKTFDDIDDDEKDRHRELHVVVKVL
jgi:hypothetical protein